MNSLAGRRLFGILALLAPLAAASVSGRQDGRAGPGTAAIQASAATPVRITSLNMQGKLDVEKVLREFLGSETLRRTDIFLLQEVHGDPRRSREFIDGLSRSLGLPFVHVSDDARLAIKGSGLAVISRFALKETAVISLKHFNLVYRSRERIALAQTVETPLGDVRLFNLHLDTRVNPGPRLEQLATLLDPAERETRPVIIGGDFNTSDFYWVAHVLPVPGYRKQRGALLKRMAGSGYQTPFESTGATSDWLGFKLDWIFFRKLRPLAAGTQKIGFSDHHAIWADILLP
jgi:endonuclease/exonuclease/phosphatase family metal-dependent hydrolase